MAAMIEVRLTTHSDIERGYFEKWCQRHFLQFDLVPTDQQAWTFKVTFREADPRRTLLLQWIAALPASWELDQGCRE